MSTAAAIRQMLAGGLTIDQALVAIEAMEAAASSVKSGAAVRQQRYREKKKAEQGITRDVTCITHNENHNDVTLTEVSHVVYTTLPSEELDITPSTLPSVATSPPKSKSTGFSEFWKAYPNKTGKGDAEAKYAKALKLIAGPDPPGQLLAAVERAKGGRQWGEGFVPNPATWLHQRRWEDEIEPPRIALRVVPDAERPDPKRLAREANLARANAGFETASRIRRLPT